MLVNSELVVKKCKFCKKDRKKNFFVVKVMESRELASITGKIRDQGSNFAKRLEEATGNLTTKKYFSSYLLLRFFNYFFHLKISTLASVPLNIL